MTLSLLVEGGPPGPSRLGFREWMPGVRVGGTLPLPGEGRETDGDFGDCAVRPAVARLGGGPLDQEEARGWDGSTGIAAAADEDDADEIGTLMFCVDCIDGLFISNRVFYINTRLDMDRQSGNRLTMSTG